MFGRDVGLGIANMNRSLAVMKRGMGDVLVIGTYGEVGIGVCGELDVGRRGVDGMLVIGRCGVDGVVERRDVDGVGRCGMDAVLMLERRGVGWTGPGTGGGGIEIVGISGAEGSLSSAVRRFLVLCVPW